MTYKTESSSLASIRSSLDMCYLIVNSKSDKGNNNNDDVDDDDTDNNEVSALVVVVVTFVLI